jgi:hypothetical protein
MLLMQESQTEILVIDKQNNMSIEKDKTIGGAIDIVCYGSLKSNLTAYTIFLNELIVKSMYKGKVKEHIAFSCKNEEFLLDTTLTDHII